MSAPAHGALAASSWVRRWALGLAAGSEVLDLACGHGRHARWLAARGHAVLALDRDALALAGLDGVAGVTPLQADIEGGPWPLPGRQFDAVVVTNYLWRPIWPHILDSLAPGGWLVVETFAHGNASVGKPSRPDFLLQPGELLRLCAELRVVAFEDGFCSAPERYVQRIAAVRQDTAQASNAAAPPRYRLDLAE